jgi:hypothetical protein
MGKLGVNGAVEATELERTRTLATPFDRHRPPHPEGVAFNEHCQEVGFEQGSPGGTAATCSTPALLVFPAREHPLRADTEQHALGDDFAGVLPADVPL